ncbi:unnamed protein product [Amoebophrya sp. A25]|nr:unnamed protein product [Amoebophrya sp. A25]|eukprot:GSA25T00008626001.1
MKMECILNGAFHTSRVHAHIRILWCWHIRIVLEEKSNLSLYLKNGGSVFIILEEKNYDRSFVFTYLFV